MESKDEEPGADKPEDVVDPDDDINLNEVIQLDEILGSGGAEKIKMLDYERQMFLDCVYNDGLVICGR